MLNKEFEKLKNLKSTAYIALCNKHSGFAKKRDSVFKRPESYQDNALPVKKDNTIIYLNFKK